MHAERRTYSRDRLPDGFVCSCYSEEHARAPHNLAVRLVDLSPRGARVLTTGRLRDRLPVIVDISVPQALARFRARAIVRWSQTLDAGAHVTGLRFDRVLESYGERLRFLGGQRPEGAPARSPEPRRRQKRFSPPKTDVVCLPQDFWAGLGLRRNVALRLKDLSLGGAQFVSTRNLKVGRRLVLSLRLARPEVSILAEAGVLWCRRDTLSLEPRWFVGVAFKQLASEDEANLRIADRSFLG